MELFSEVVDGSGPEAKTGDLLEFDFVCRRSNGYFVYRYANVCQLLNTNYTMKFRAVVLKQGQELVQYEMLNHLKSQDNK